MKYVPNIGQIKKLFILIYYRARHRVGLYIFCENRANNHSVSILTDQPMFVFINLELKYDKNFSQE